MAVQKTEKTNDPESGKKPTKPKVTKVKSGNKVTKVRKGLPRSNEPVVLPDEVTFLKQPTLVTLMKYDFTVSELRIFLSIIEELQVPIEESLTKKVEPEQLTLFQEFKDSDSIYIPIPTKNFGFTPDRYRELKQTLKKMVTIPVELDVKDPISGEDSWLIKGMFEAIVPKDRYKRHITIKIHKDIAKYLINVDKGFTKFIKEIATNVSNKYAVRIYMFISSWKDKGGVRLSYDKFRSWLQLEDKYQNFKDLYKRVIRPAYEALHEKADCWFELEEEYSSPDAKEPAYLNFKIIKAAATVHEKEKLELQRRNIEGLLFRRFQMEDKHIQQVLKLVTLENVMLVLEKIGEVANYISDNPGKIKNKPEYALTSILKVFKTYDEYQEIKE